MKRWTFVLMLLAMSLAACDETTAPSNSLAGSYSASVFRVTPSGQSEVDVLAEGGSLSMTIADNNATTGTLNIPSSIGGGLNASMAGTAILSGSSVTFQQGADTFLRDLSWARSGTALVVTNQVLSGAAYTITLSRQ